MNIRLVILGLLQRRPMHGYEIKQEIERGMGDWTDIAFGSIYFAISKLAEEQSISESGKEKVGNRPSRIIYTITEKGRQEFIRILRDEWRSEQRNYYPVDLAVYFMSFLSKEEVRGYLERMILKTGDSLQELEAHAGDLKNNPYIPPLAFAIIDHTRRHLCAERDWLEDLASSLDEIHDTYPEYDS